MNAARERERRVKKGEECTNARPLCRTFYKTQERKIKF